MTNRFIRKLPDAFCKDKSSNNYKLLSLDSEDFDQLERDLSDLRKALTLDGATGSSLDVFGLLFEQPRNGMSDALYRYFIKAKIARNRGGGNYESIAEAVTVLLDCESESFSLEDASGPCVARLAKLPYSVLKQAGLTTRQFAEMVGSILPVCVTLDDGNYEGTFEFGETATEYDADKGFADLEGTVGGFFGLMLGEDDSVRTVQ